MFWRWSTMCWTQLNRRYREKQQAEEEYQRAHQYHTGAVVETGGLSALTEAAQLLAQDEIAEEQECDKVVNDVIRSSELKQMISATMPTGPTPIDLVSRVRMGLTPSFILPAYKAGSSPRTTSAIPARLDGVLVDCSALASLPSHVVITLVKKYIQRLLPLMPFMVESVVWKQVDIVLASVGVEDEQSNIKAVHRIQPSYDHVIVYTILAISATLGCAKSRHESRCMAFSEILFKEGIQHLCNEAPFPNDLAGVQLTLLILQYAEINPKCANVWVLGGAAMRSCLELGLHREPSVKVIDPDPATLDLRRRIFWMAYCLDRTICSALQRPLSIPDPAINTQYPFLEPRDPHTGDALQSTTHESSPALHLIGYCRLQSVMTEVHFQGKSLGFGQTWEDWLIDTEQSLRRWYEECRSVDEAQAEFGLVHGLVSLHRPSPRMPTPSVPSLVIAFEAACDSARIYREKILYGFVRRPWLAAHHTAESAMVALFSLRSSFPHIVGRFSVGDVFEKMKSFTTNLLHISGQGWTEITKFAARFERLLAPLLDALLQGDDPSTILYPPEYDAELSRYLYPGPAHLDYLQFGNQSTTTVAVDAFDPEMSTWNDAFAEIFDTGDSQDAQ
ncbi:putative c6 transcription factor [Phaeomoniella chlamydospora]|uniref:Putative c6 transcription factor n=1 Tax=Phaeomoniella chlamydospora TaxID=158046 RepID=A0A0G2E2B2_PHACM|nr:putative c6 transcription factor [Phaeomoniella chlamydospora]